MPRLTAKSVAALNGIVVAHALYRKSGDWYHLPKSFPAVLLDQGGFILFSNRSSFDDFVNRGQGNGVTFGIEKNWISVSKGIRVHDLYRPYEQFASPDEVEGTITFIEGATRQVTVNQYERSALARAICIKAWGCACIACGFSFEAVYGSIGVGLIHVHHLTPISSIKSDYTLDPKRDLRPVCPNCHAILHRKYPPLSIEDLKSLLGK